jgi:hypothetical protein
MTVSGFFDESGKFKDHAVISFGGVAAPAQNFSGNFVQDWRHSLIVNGLGMLTVKEAFTAGRPLSERTPALGITNRIEAILPFIACIRKHLQLVTGVALDVDAFKALPSHYFKVLGNRPEFTAFLRMVLRVVDATSSDDKINLICDDEEEMALPMFRLYRRVKLVNEDAREKLASISFADDRFLYGLQAADMVSSLMRREADRKFFGTSYDYSPLFDALTKPPAAFEGIWGAEIAFCDKEVLSRLANDLKEPAPGKDSGRE